ncbi:Aggrecan core protein, partial [Tauraco erythrolophus]
GVENSTVKHCNAWFLPLIFGRLNPARSVIPNPSHQDSSTKQICQNLCQKGWINFKGHWYLLERMTFPQAEVLASSKQQYCHLTSITSADENEFLCNLAQEQKETQFWTGGSSPLQLLELFFCLQGLFLKWSGGSLTTFIQRPLLPLFRAVGGLVSNLFNIKICLTLNIRGRGEWDSSPCLKRLPFNYVYKPKLM